MVNKSLENYLRCFVADKPSQWSELLHWAEWWYNTTFHSAIKMTQFQAVYGTPQPSIPMYLLGTIVVHAVDVILRDQNEFLTLLKSHLAIAQNCMKQQSDQNRTEREFSVGDWVYLKLHPYRQQSMVKRPAHKLSPRYYGPFPISARIGPVAYKLALPPHSKIHPVFHVSLLKKNGDQLSVTSTLPPIIDDNSFGWVPSKVLDMEVIRKGNRSITKWLVQWTGLPAEDATWEETHTLINQFPHLRT